MTELDSIENDKTLSCKEFTTHGEHVNRVETHMSRPHTEESASHLHELREAGLEYVSQDNPVVAVQIVNATKGFGKGLSEAKHSIPQTPSIGATLPNRAIRGGMTDSCTNKIDLVISASEDGSTFTVRERTKGAKLNRRGPLNKCY